MFLTHLTALERIFFSCHKDFARYVGPTLASAWAEASPGPTERVQLRA
jgi:hypothetical protein